MSRKVYFHVLDATGEIEKIIDLDNAEQFNTEVPNGEWFNVDGAPCAVQRIESSTDRVDIYVKPISRQAYN